MSRPSTPFKIGDRVVIVRSRFPHMIGRVEPILSELEQAGAPSGLHATAWPEGTWVHVLVAGDTPLGYPPSHLELYRPDDRVSAEWDELTARLCGVKSRKGRSPKRRVASRNSRNHAERGDRR